MPKHQVTRKSRPIFLDLSITKKEDERVAGICSLSPLFPPEPPLAVSQHTREKATRAKVLFSHNCSFVADFVDGLLKY